jgi:hypothetical protein
VAASSSDVGSSGEDDRRTGRERPGDGDALLLAARTPGSRASVPAAPYRERELDVHP